MLRHTHEELVVLCENFQPAADIASANRVQMTVVTNISGDRPVTQFVVTNNLTGRGMATDEKGKAIEFFLEQQVRNIKAREIAR